MTMLATCVLFYVISGILFWTTDYFTEVIGVKKDEVTVAFGLTSITAPVFGAIASIPLETKIGFKSPATLPTCLVVAILCYAVAFFIPFYDKSLYAIIAHIWFLLFFGGMLLPITNGRILEIVPKKYSAHG
jgi:MFS family permease